MGAVVCVLLLWVLKFVCCCCECRSLCVVAVGAIIGGVVAVSAVVSVCVLFLWVP